ncbi:MAG: glycosyl transferase family protein [Pseudomonadota bacterium]
MSLAEHVRILGRGPGRARSLTEAEATDAMTLMLSGHAAPEAIGALLMLMRMKGETAEEIAGFAQAAQTHLVGCPPADLDWPCYAAGRSRGQPWFLLAARLVAQSGVRVLLHGWNGDDSRVRDALGPLGIPWARNADAARTALDGPGIAYLSLEDGHPALFSLLALRSKLGLRSCINTVCRMLNPGRAPASVQGVFHPSYRALQADAAARLDWHSLTVIKGGGGEFERHPGKEVAAFGLRAGTGWQHAFPALSDDVRRLADLTTTGAALAELWDADRGPSFGRALVMGTAALAFETVGVPNGMDAAHRLWPTRHAAPRAA